MNSPKKIAVAYSGGLDTSVIIPWLKEKYGCEVVAVVADVGQGAQELEGIEAKAKKTGASSCHIKDLRKAFLEEFVWPMVISGSVYEGKYLLGTSIARPIIARAQVEVALKTGCDALAHGCTGKGNDQVRFESTYAALAPHLQIIAPWRMWDLRSREQLLGYLKQRNIPCAASAEKIYSRDANLWHISHEGGELEDPWNAPPEDVWMRSVSPLSAPDAPEEVMISFEQGVPVALNGKKTDAVTLVEKLNAIGGKHGVGRVDIVENRLVGMKSRGCYETPGGTIITAAARGLEELVLDRTTLHYREKLSHDFSEIIYEGSWFTPLREAMWASFASIARVMTGDIVVRLHKGSATVIKRRSPHSLYSESFATFGADEVYDQSHAGGFIRLYSLPARIRALKAKHSLDGGKASKSSSSRELKPAGKSKLPAKSKAQSKAAGKK
ncbi:MAG: argininosuccinate synthase [Phycisphaerae bacterium]|jgi:argininosuccinate synthase|nr:argininosuccinate synthase [Phycisphaerae bacterium]